MKSWALMMGCVQDSLQGSENPTRSIWINEDLFSAFFNIQQISRSGAPICVDPFPYLSIIS